MLPDRVSIYSAAAQRVWEYAVRKPVDVWPTARGMVLVTFNGDKKGTTPGGVREGAAGEHGVRQAVAVELIADLCRRAHGV